jgi:type II secretory pathway pseudopilin PulG
MSWRLLLVVAVGVLVVIGLVVAVALVLFDRREKRRETMEQLAQVRECLDAIMLADIAPSGKISDHEKPVPERSRRLSASLDAAFRCGIVLLDDRDAWGEPLRLRMGKNVFEYSVWSCGPDRHDDGGEGDDIVAPDPFRQDWNH